MKNRFALPIILLFIAGALLFNSCAKEKQALQTTKEIPVEVTTVQRHTMERELQFTGSVEPWQKTNLGAQMPGIVKKIYVEPGDAVKKGQLLVQMDDAQLTQARVQFELAKQDFERMKPLLKEGSISPSQFDKIKGAYQAAKAGYELTLANTQIRAPFDGMVTTKWIDEGEVFQLMPGAAGSPAILTVMQFDPLKISIHIPESDISSVVLGQEATIQSDVIPGQIFKGKVTRIDPAIDPLTRTFGAEIRVANPQRQLRPGMFCRVRLSLGDRSVLAVPRAALIRQVGTSHYYAFVVENNVARRRDLQLGQRFDDLFEIKSGLRAGEALVIEGQYLLKDGLPVKVTAPSGTQQ